MNFEIVDASDRLPAEPYLSLLLMSAFPRPHDERIRIGEAFRDSEDRVFWVALLDGLPAGGCGVVASSADVATIRYLAVDRKLRGRGLGRCLVETAIARTDRSVVEAETDDDTTAFYAKCGFDVESLGEKYPGTVRYLCRYTKRRPV